MDATTLIVAIVGAVLGSGVISAVVTGLFMRRKVGADTALSLQKVWHEEFNRLSARVTELEKEVKGRDMSIAELERENKELKAELQTLKAQNEKLIKTNRDLASRINKLEEKLKENNLNEC